jgi:curved DNA-binding protein CbpA
MDSTKKDFYYILGIGHDATLQQIKSAFRKLSMKFHPDKNEGDLFFEDQFKEIQEAYEILSDPIRRQKYDAARKSQELKEQELRRKEDEIRIRQEELRRKEEELKVKKEDQWHRESSNKRPYTNPPVYQPIVPKSPGKLKQYIDRNREPFSILILGLIIYSIVAIGVWYSESKSNSTHLKNESNKDFSASENTLEIDSQMVAVQLKVDSLIKSHHAKSIEERRIKVPKGYFTVGSTKDEVIIAQGTPTKFDDSEWEFGLSSIYFLNDKVSTWDISPLNPLKAKMVPSDQSKEYRRYFTIGSTKDEVLVAQGTPTKFNQSEWEYGLSSIYFLNDKVSTWDISPLNPLKAKMKTSEK